MTRLFITFEGGEGSGKSTQIARLAEHLRSDGRFVVVTREPGGSPGADAIRHIILSGAAEELGAEVEAILFTAARADHVQTLIGPALDRGEIVLCDRFGDSTAVYQLQGEDIDPKLVERLERAATRGLRPDLTIVLDVPAAVGLERARRRRGKEAADRFEKDNEAVQEFRRQAFLKIAADDRERCVVVDGTKAADEIAKEIAAIVDDRVDAGRLDAIGRNLTVEASK